jgi:TolB-like protein/tetratricopeptide (TPR) repeat protein
MVEPRHAFGPFVLDVGCGLLQRSGKSVAIGQRGLALLQALLEADGGIVSKAVLMERGWPDTIVEDGNLTVQISALRKTLGPAPNGREWIATVPRVGYRLVRLIDGSETTNIALSVTPALAVLPFANLSGVAEQDYFSKGVVDDIITALSRFKSFAVIARNSSFVFREVDVRRVAKELGVRYVLEGSVRRSGNRLRITARLVEGVGGAHLWAQSFDGELDNLFEFQDDITERVATIVGPLIQRAEISRSRGERPGSIAAYDIYLRALSKILTESASDNAEAFALLAKGLTLEPDNALLNAHAAWALEHRITMGWPPLGPEDREKCFMLARRGLENSAGDPAVTAHCAMALIQVAREYDWGMAVLKEAVEANPNNLMVVTAAGVANLHCGSIEMALALFHRASRLSPRDPLAHISLCGTAHAQMILGNYSDVLVWAARALAINPNFDASLWMLIAANAHLGRLDHARHFLVELKKASPGITIARIKAGQPAKEPSRISAILEGLRLAGLEED